MKYTCEVFPSANGGPAMLVMVPPAMWPAQRALLDKSAEKHSCYLSLDVSLPHKPRSTGWKSQNHHLWGHAAQIGTELGYDRREMLYLIASMTNEWPMMRYKDKQVPVSEAQISSDVSSAAIETAHRIAADNNITLREDSE